MTELMSDAVNLMVVGMGFVFVFLTVLVFATSLMSKIILKYAPAPEPKAPAASPVTQASNDAQLLAVLSAAVSKYRSDHKK
jgi:oxaloacetate decarboxylase (Na+ extruding) subunit gamma